MSHSRPLLNTEKKKRIRTKYDRLNEKHWCKTQFIIPPDNWKAPNKWVYCPKCKEYLDRFYVTTKQLYPVVGGKYDGQELANEELARDEGYELFNPTFGGRCVLVYTRGIHEPK
jgi:hypothetical protein